MERNHVVVNLSSQNANRHLLIERHLELSSHHCGVGNQRRLNVLFPWLKLVNTLNMVYQMVKNFFKAGRLLNVYKLLTVKLPGVIFCNSGCLVEPPDCSHIIYCSGNIYILVNLIFSTQVNAQSQSSESERFEFNSR